ncbi:hypothetical protein [Kaistella antarctica]|uniref:Uncharacterized protein n=2 Tax=Kaistella antarctica TaxID=266748 RepID=A0A448NNQ5_9FLAO|nr:hypothetical protein [Kaistella antarctica]KEY19686.1 hypothetical protein HY04_00155 [Kaistella antarctica]SEV98961.1 hypothetical protein SAMN05421765_1743 [Kaistella antarctica]VEH96752.1 Uncharacterised protein [Kaistella antarctica]
MKFLSLQKLWVMENLDVLRSRLVQKIFLTKNIDLLDALDKIFSSTENDSELKFKLSETQKEMLLMAEDDIKYGRTLTDEELRKLDEEWMQ